MQADIKRHRSGEGSSVWIDPAYMRRNFVSAQGLSVQDNASEQEQPSLDEASARRGANHSARGEGQSEQRRQRNPLTPVPPTMPDALTSSASSTQPASSSQPPHSPIPPRASAHTLRAPGVRPKRYVTSPIEDSGDITRIPTIPQSRQSQQQSPIWQYESPDYEIESSISSLSLVVSDQPTHPETPSAGNVPRDVSLLVADLPTRPESPQGVKQRRQTVPLHIPDMPTQPDPVKQHDVSIDEIDTIPASALVVSAPLAEGRRIASADVAEPINDALTVPGQALIVRRQGADVQQEGMTSWTAGGAGASPLARRIADPSRGKSRHSHQHQAQSTQVSFNPLDQVRWWLLHPGRIEFILWLAGTLLLISITCIFLFTTALSFGWITTGSLSRFVSSPASNTTPQSQKPLPTVVTYPGLKLVLLDQGPLLAGQSIHLHGEGFTAQGRVVFTYDNWHQFSAQGGMTNLIKADAHGSFTATLILGTGPDWLPGLHLIEAKDLATGHLADVTCPLSQGPIGKGGTTGSATPGPGPVTPGSTPTPSYGTPVTGPGPIPTPVGQTPVPITPTPTVVITPTPTQPSATPTPTQPSATPTPTTPPSTPTPVITPTVGGSPTPGASTGTTGAPSTIAGVGATLMASNTPVPMGLWLFIPGYAFAMLLLGLAGVLHKRHQ